MTDKQTDSLDTDGTDSGTDPDDAADTPETTDEASLASDVDAEADPSDGTDSGVDTDRLRRYVERGFLAALFLFALVAAFRFYFAASNAVSYWVATRYQSAFQAAFNLVVLLVVVAAIVWQLRRMR